VCMNYVVDFVFHIIIFFFFFFFFFQAEDGIRDKLVTGVQTCALPISARRVDENYRTHRSCRETCRRRSRWTGLGLRWREHALWRSEERRVGKECRSRWWADH